MIPIEFIKERIKELENLMSTEETGGEYISKMKSSTRINALNELIEEWEKNYESNIDIR